MAAALAGMLVITVGTAYYCHLLLRDATAGGPVGESGLLVLFSAFFIVASLVVVLFQSMHVANRVAGPELRLTQAIKRMRSGDLSFRIHLRRGDLLAPLASECNELLDWLNANPPAGVETGSDVVHVEVDEATDLNRTVCALEAAQ